MKQEVSLRLVAKQLQLLFKTDKITLARNVVAIMVLKIGEIKQLFTDTATQNLTLLLQSSISGKNVVI